MNQIPVTVQYFRTMNDKDIIQLFFEGLNQAMSLLTISYHYIGSVTVSYSNRHLLSAGCLSSWYFFLDILAVEGETKWLSQNVGMELPLYAVHNHRREQASKHAQFQCDFPSEEHQMVV